MKLSIVATLYQSAPYIEEFYQRMSVVAKQLVGDAYEFILVNDGSPDNSLELAVRLTSIDNHVIVVDLSRNFGHHRAMMTGLSTAKGDMIYLLDSDLEEEPEWLLLFKTHMDNTGCDVTYGVQTKRKGSTTEKIFGRLFYSIFQKTTGLNIPANIVVARLMTRRYVNALLQHQEREIFMAGLWQITGFEQQAISVTKHNTSETTYTFSRKLSMLTNSIVSFSNLPLIGIFYFGVSVFLVACGYSFFLLANKFYLHNILSGWTSVMASVWFFGGLIISSIGIIGIYLSKIFSEVKQRPYTIVRKIYSHPLGSVDDSSKTFTTPTCRGLATASMDPVNKPRDVGVGINY